jgi:CHAP domain
MMTTTAAMDKAVDIAESAAGYNESACSATVGNNTRYGVWYGMNCSAWCAMFVSKCYSDAGFPQPASTSKGFAYTPSGAAWYQSKKAWSSAGTNPERGWVVFFYSVSAGRIAHVGLVRGPRGSDGLIPTVEGNTNGAGSAEGGGVLLKRRSPSQSLSFRIAGYGRPDLIAGAEQEWWQMGIPATELQKIQDQAEQALASAAGQKALSTWFAPWAEQIVRRTVYSVMTGGIGAWSNPERDGWDWYTTEVQSAALRHIRGHQPALDDVGEALAAQLETHGITIPADLDPATLAESLLAALNKVEFRAQPSGE